MNKGYIIGFLIIGCLLSQNVVSAQAQAKEKEVAKEQIEMTGTEIRLSVEGMTCQAGCADGIDKALGSKEGVTKCKTTYSTGSSVIWYDKDVITEKEIIALIADKGFKASVSKNVQVDEE